MRVLHLASAAEWAEALVSGSYRRSSRDRTLAEEGFIHASTASALPAVVQRFYADVELDRYVLLVVDAATCHRAGSRLRWEFPPGGPDGAGEEPPARGRFPHVYGPIPIDAVVAVLPIGQDGGFLRMPDLTGLDVADQEPLL